MLFARAMAICLLLTIGASQLIAATSDELAKATDKGKTVYLLVFEPNAPGIESAREMVNTASKQVKKSIIIELNRADVTNAALVAKYRLAGAPIPLIMILCAVSEDGSDC
jgi:hypothetical protein